jgi:hypothetical protein
LKIVFLEEGLLLADNFSFSQIDHIDDLSSLEKIVNIHLEAEHLIF